MTKSAWDNKMDDSGSHNFSEDKKNGQMEIK